jgi:hypothetical protein
VTACDTLIAAARSRCSTGLALGSKGGFNCSLRAALTIGCAAVNASRGIPGKIWTDLSLLARRTFRHLPGQAEAGPRPSHVTESGRSILAVKSGYAAFSRLEENPPETISELRTSEANCAATYFRSWGGMPIKWRGTSCRPFPMVGGPLVRVPRPTVWLATATRRSRQRDSELCLCRARKRNSHQSNLRWL